MIDIHELRIGNLVYAHPFRIIKVSEITNLKSVLNEGDESEEPFADEELDGIPLTQEILEKCGMPMHEPELFTGDRQITITELSIIQIAPDNTLELIVTMFRGDSYPKMGMPEPRIKYLHQLQNLHFALFGTELEINLTEKD